MVKIMENPIKIDDLGVPLFLETPTCSVENGCYHLSCEKKTYHLPWIMGEKGLVRIFC